MSTSKKISRTILVSILGLALAHCTKKADAPTAATNDTELNLAIWGNYLTPEMQAQFEKETGIKVNITNYSSNEELLAKVQSGASGIDMAIPSDYMVEIMAKTDLLQPLDYAQIPNKASVIEDMLKPDYDPEQKYSLPYTWSTAGIVVNTEMYAKPITSWKEFFTEKDLKGKISMLDDVREVTAAALKMNNLSVNTTKPDELKKAKDTLIAAKPNIKMFRSDTIEALLKKEVAVAQSYSTDALQAVAQNPKLKYIIPTEGGTRAVDTMVILKGAKHPMAAHKLINFMLDSKTNEAFVTKIRGGPVLKTTKEHLTPELQANTALFPPADQLNKLERLKDVGDNTKMYDDLWTEIKTE